MCQARLIAEIQHATLNQNSMETYLQYLKTSSIDP